MKFLKESSDNVVIVEPDHITKILKVGDIIKLKEDVYYCDLEFFADNYCGSGSVSTEKAIQLADLKYGFKYDSEEDMVYYPIGSELELIDDNGDGGWPVFKMVGKSEGVDFAGDEFRATIIEKSNLNESIKESFGKKVRAHFECETCFLKYYQDTDEDYFEDEEDFNNVMEDSYLECPRCETENRASYAEVEPEEFTVEEHEYNYKECDFDTEYDDGVEYDEDNDEWYFADDDYDDLDESINKNDKHLKESTTLPGISLWDKLDEAEKRDYKFVHLAEMGERFITSKKDFWDFYRKIDRKYGVTFNYRIDDDKKTVYYWEEPTPWWM